MAPWLSDSADTEQPGDLGLPTPPHELPALRGLGLDQAHGLHHWALGVAPTSSPHRNPQPSSPFSPNVVTVCSPGVCSVRALSAKHGLPKSLELGWDTSRERQSSSSPCVTTEQLCLPAGCTAVQGRVSKIPNLRAAIWPRLHGFWRHSHCKWSAVDWPIDRLIPRIHLTEKVPLLLVLPTLRRPRCLQSKLSVSLTSVYLCPAWPG